MSVQLRSFSFRFAEQVFNSRLQLKQEINEMLLEACKDLSVLGRPAFNRILKDLFVEKNWISQPRVSPEMKAYSKFDFIISFASHIYLTTISTTYITGTGSQEVGTADWKR